MAGKKPMVERLMELTGKLRMIFGPAQKSGVDHPMSEENRQLLKRREAEAAQWETVKRPDGSTYIVPKR